MTSNYRWFWPLVAIIFAAVLIFISIRKEDTSVVTDIEKELEWEKVSVESDSGVRLIGSAFRPGTGEEPAPLLILLPSFGHNRHNYDALATHIRRQGIGVLSIDLRGMGESAEHVEFDQVLSPESIRKAPVDIRAVIEYAKSLPWVDRRRIGVLGNSFSANALVMAVAPGDSLRFVVLMSGGYAPAAFQKAAEPWFPPIVAIASYEDGVVAQQTKEIYDASGRADSEIKFLMQAGHGMDMLLGKKQGELLAYLDECVQRRIGVSE